MNTSTMRWMIAAAALAVAAGSASAQTYKAEIPMPFRAAGKLMAPGPYEIRLARSSGNEVLFVHNNTTNSSTVLMAAVKSDAPKQWLQDGNPKLEFGCVDGACTLSKMWNGSDPYLYDFPSPKAPAADVAHRSEFVTLTMIKAH